MPSTIIKDKVSTRWTIHTSQGPELRPDLQFPDTAEDTEICCPFCPSHEEMTPAPLDELTGPTGEWLVRVVPNRYPALTESDQVSYQNCGIYSKLSGTGKHLVIIDHPDHDKHLHKLDDTEVTRLFEVYRQQLAIANTDPDTNYTMIFKNHGPSGGATIAHPHTQLSSLPFLPNSIEVELSKQQQIYLSRRRCYLCDLAESEALVESRVICRNSAAIAFVPQFAANPFEIWVIPQEHNTHFNHASAVAVSQTAILCRDAICACVSSLIKPSYNMVICSSPAHEPKNSYHHWMIKLKPVITRTTGLTLGSGIAINQTASDSTAAYMRKNLR